MGYGHINYIPGLVAGEDLSSGQYKAVKHASTAGQVLACAATTDAAIGILQNDPASGEAANVAGVGSVAKAVAGTSTVSAGNLLGYNSTGQLENHTTDGRYIFAQAQEDAAASGDIIQVTVQGLSSYAG